MSINVTTIASSLNGGAGKAALRLHLGLLKSPGVNAKLVQAENDITKEDGQNIITAQKRRWGLQDKVLYKLGIDKRKTGSYKAKVFNEISARYEVVTFPFSEFDLEDAPEVAQADVIHLHWVGNFVHFPTFFTKVKKPIVWTMHDMNAFLGLYHYEGDRERNAHLLAKYDAELIAAKAKYLTADVDLHIVCLSNWLMEKSRQSSILGKYPHYLIPNGLDLTKYPEINKEEARAATGIDNGNKTLLCVAQNINHYRKGFDILAKALSLLNGVNFNIITVGGDAITFPGNIKNYHFGNIDNDAEINRLYTAADLVVLPSREDNLPNIMLEAFANGTPVLSFETGGMKDWIMPGINGLLAKPFEAASLAEELIKFNNGDYTFDSAAIRAFACTNFSVEKQVAAYLNLYHQII